MLRSALVRSKNVTGSLVKKWKPWAGAHISLRESPGAYVVGAKTKLAREIGSAITDNGGSFSFENVKPGRYTIFVEAEMMDLQVVFPAKDQGDKILARFDRDSCLQVSVISADGGLVHQMPAIQPSLQITTASRYSPYTFRMASEISPTVA